MTDPAEQSHHLKSCGRPSGGSSADKHLPASQRAAPHNGTRGRQRGEQQDKLWHSRGGQRGVCPGLAAGNDRADSLLAPQPQVKNPEDAAAAPQPVEPLSQAQEGLPVDSDTGLDARLGRKRHRRRAAKKKRHWKPYYKLSWEERKALEERETARASRLREEMFAKGLPVAPYNTTQFLMDEHDREEPDLNTETGPRRTDDTGSEEDLFEHDDEEEDDGSGGGGGSSDGIGRPGNAGGEFLQRDFSETYEMYHVESLQNMTKQELVQEYLELEKCMSRLEEENNRLRRAVEPGGLSVDGSLVRLRELERELERLRAQNTELLLQSQSGEDRGQVTSD
ncbi:protein HEXIM1 [Dunckerocampus dactyliophorus]|uniref:protein HEXIM1 n=1 Tax=Dunckerocampus dactyliophorus TaxID=161453 RepID=UPI002404CA36|nr:protein HEXIM1 [Dunckerocampus dactyliophorus]